jgi:hypothetical protein
LPCGTSILTPIDLSFRASCKKELLDRLFLKA